MAAGNDNEEFDTTGRNSLVDLLAFLRNRGSALLVVGTVPTDVHHDVSRQMLGTDEADVRRRVLALTAGEPGAITDRLPATTTPSPSTETTIISYQSPTRGSTMVDANVTADSSVLHVEESNLGEFLAAINREVERYERTDVDNPVSFRFCLESLSPLLSEHDRQSVFRFLHLVIARIRSIRAIGHVHLQTDHNAEYARFVEPLFDAVVELGLDDRGRPQQRWHLTDHDVTSRWLLLDRPES